MPPFTPSTYGARNSGNEKTSWGLGASQTDSSLSGVAAGVKSLAKLIGLVIFPRC